MYELKNGFTDENYTHLLCVYFNIMIKIHTCSVRFRCLFYPLDGNLTGNYKDKSLQLVLYLFVSEYCQELRPNPGAERWRLKTNR